MTLLELKESGEAPEWLTEEGLITLQNGYLLPGETPKAAYKRVARAAALYYDNVDYWESKFFNLFWENLLGPSSPILANLGTDRGLPCSCNSIHVGDSISSIFSKVKEFAHLSSKGAGVGIYLGDVRPKGSRIGKNNGFSEGIVPWAKVFDSTTLAVSQGGVRRGANAFYLPIDHGDIHEFVQIRRHTGDINRRALNSNHAVIISDQWLEDMLAGDIQKRSLWGEVLKARFETGEPYLMFGDTVNKANPVAYQKNNLKVSTSNICSEIVLYTDPDHTFVCLLSSLNLLRWDKIQASDAVETSIYFLDAVMEDYIQKTAKLEGFEASHRSAVKGRAIGLGVMGWHSLLQSKMIPFDSFDAMMLNARIFSTIRERAEKASRELAALKGEPEWCKGTGMRHTHLLAIAPTVSNSTISGGVSPSIEPWAANIFVQKSAKGNFIRKNVFLEQLLESKGMNTPEVWSQINKDRGSVQGLKGLSAEEKEVFLTFRELNQHVVVKQAAQRQRWIDQAQSVNLAFPLNADPKYIHEVHLAAWREGLKTLYYLRSEGVLRGDQAFRSADECKACEG
ncbi:MAG: ribonucleoside-diphosphate reductase subunit alpha [Candidatus Bilamarchaeaceae archaeon]